MVDRSLQFRVRANGCATERRSKEQDLCQGSKPSVSDLGQIKGGCLINLIDPIPVQKMRMGSPTVLRGFAWIVVGIIIARNIDWCAIGNVAIIFFFQRTTVVFKVVKDIKRAVL